jgi:hypothetical protein
MSVTVEQYARLQNELAEVRRVAHANGQRVVELESELLQVRPVAQALHDLCAVPTDDEDAQDDWQAAFDAAYAAHKATTPSSSPATHAIVAVERLKHLEVLEYNVDEAAGRFFTPGGLAPASAYSEGWVDAVHYVMNGELPDDDADAEVTS